jgi:peptidoglycan/xylan/chitin deacetylase (PgdA/CDA1 family)
MGIRHALMMMLALAPSLALALTAGAPAGEAAADLPAPVVSVSVALPPAPDLEPVMVPVRSPAAPDPAKPLYRLPTDQRQIVLTIDDGPSAFTPAILKILAENQVPAVFFWIGGNKGLDMAAEVIKQGHQVGSHTWSHPVLTKLDAAGQHDQLVRAQEALRKGAGAEIPFVRPPYGSQNADTLKIAAELKQTVVLWNVDSRDWALADHPEQIVPNVLSQVKPGSIILMHERAQTVQVLPDLIKRLKAEGYTFQSLPAPS